MQLDHNPEIEMMPVELLTPYAQNSRTHSKEQVAQIAASIQEYGFTNPVLIDNDDVLIAGHGRVMAAKQLGLFEVPAIRLGHLNEAQKRAYVIADNKLALNAGWDDEVLAQELTALKDLDYDLTLTGFDDEELSDIFDDLEPDEEPGDPQEKIPDDNYKEQYGCIVICDSESHQEKVFNKLIGMGYKVKVVAT